MRFVPDAFVLDRTNRRIPPNPTANDIAVPTPGCEGRNIAAFVVQAGTGAVAFSCEGRTYRDGQGDILTTEYRLLAWNASNHKLGNGSFDDLFVLTPTGEALPVTGLSGSRSFTDARAHPSGVGFWLAFTPTGGFTVQQLWYIDNAGVATLHTTYGAFPPNVRAAAPGIVDSTGALHTQTVLDVEPYTELVVRRPADGSPGTVVYSEGNAPSPVNVGANYERLYTFMHQSYLFAGP
jgi:hypothetical protein